MNESINRNVHPDPFTLAAYERLISETSRRYDCVGFDILSDESNLSRNFCLLRHDIDNSPENALRVAEIEARMGVRSTWTVLLTGYTYNPFEQAVRDILIKIAELGHDIGLHFDAAWHQIERESQLEEVLQSDSRTLERLLCGLPIKMFSFHNATKFTMNCKAVSYAGLWNAYAGLLQENVSYVSDSNGLWRFRTWSEALAQEPPRIQILTHAEWWTEDEQTPAEKTAISLRDRARKAWTDYCRLLKSGDRPNVSPIPVALELLPAIFGSNGCDIVQLWLSGDRELGYLGLVRLVDALVLSAIRQRLDCGSVGRKAEIEQLWENGGGRTQISHLIALAGPESTAVLGEYAGPFVELQAFRLRVAGCIEPPSIAELEEALSLLCAVANRIDPDQARQTPSGTHVSE